MKLWASGNDYLLYVFLVRTISSLHIYFYLLVTCCGCCCAFAAILRRAVRDLHTTMKEKEEIKIKQKICYFSVSINSRAPMTLPYLACKQWIYRVKPIMNFFIKKCLKQISTIFSHNAVETREREKWTKSYLNFLNIFSAICIVQPNKHSSSYRFSHLNVFGTLTIAAWSSLHSTTAVPRFKTARSTGSLSER